jgi:hypothetical protein
MTRLVFELVGIWQDIGVRYDDEARLSHRFEILHDSELETPVVYGSEMDHTLTLDALEGERVQIESLVGMIRHVRLRKAEIARNQEAVGKHIRAALRIDPGLYSPTNPRSIGQRNQKDIVRDLRARKAARTDRSVGLQSEIRRNEARLAGLEELLMDRRDKIGRRRTDLTETELRAGLDESRRFALKSVASFARSIRREIDSWKTDEGRQPESLLESWQLSLEAHGEDLRRNQALTDQ